jgi:FkbM family methyltransferase
MKKILFDVGANNGSTSVYHWLGDTNNLIYGFEPTPEMCAQIESKIEGHDNYILTKKAVSDFNGKATFNVAGTVDWGCSSLLEFSDKSQTEWPNKNTAWDFQVTHQIEVDVIRLDTFIEENNITVIDYLHVDTQGSDLKVLKGLGKYIDIVVSGVVEAATKPDILYYNQCTKEECIKFLEDNGFKIVNVQSNDDQGNEVNIFFSRE